MKRFGVKFGDNDFQGTFRTMLPVVAQCIYDREREISKEELVRLLKDCVYSFYRLGQNMYEYNSDEDSIEKYLQDGISIDNVFIDDEINKERERLGSNTNWDFFCCELPTSYTEPVFFSY